MGKRTILDSEGSGAHNGSDIKRQRIQGTHHERSSPRPNPTATAVSVTDARQLQKALFFDQTAASDFRSGLGLFKSFLDSILYTSETDDLPRKRAILREYLDTQKGRGRDEKDKTFLPNLIQAWDYAVETNFEPILSSVTAVFALLFKTLATHPDLTDYGTLLAQTILQPAVARRLVRSTSAAPNKDSVISPALRLLIELTRFNQGAHAKAVYGKRDFTLEPKILARNIGLRKEQSAADHQKRPSVRTTAIRYLLTHLSYQDERAKSEILSNVNVVRSVFDHISSDPPFLISEIFEVFKSHVFQDKTIARSTKSRILNGKTLSRIAGLYSHELQEGSLEPGQKSPDVLAHDFLRMVCTDPAYGVMLPSNGFYPLAADDEDRDLDDLAEFGDDIGADLVDSQSKAGKIRNIILSEFIQNQRPYANTLHQQLVIDIFTACPELVADYFIKRKDFSYDPKLTSTWIGYSAFLYQTVQIPVPKYFGAKRNFRDQPPPVAVLSQSILPQPLSQQVLVKCFNHNSDLVQFFAVRILVAALQKLQAFLATLDLANSVKPSKRWGQTSKGLVTEISRRCPPIRTVFLALKKPGAGDIKRESITRLLRLYYEVMPQVALQEKFDVSLPLCTVLAEIEKPTVSPEEKVYRVMELEHWVQMAMHSPAMRWWQKQKTLQHSPFVMLIKLMVTSKDHELYAGVKTLLRSILRDQDMLQTQTSPDAFDALIASLGASPGSSTPSPDVLDFLDDCCARFTKTSIKYIDDMDAARAEKALQIDDLGPFSPLLMTLVEQWSYRGGETATGKSADSLAQWLSKVLYLFKLIGEDESMLDFVQASLVTSGAKAYKDVLKDAFLWKMGKESAKEALKLATGADFSGSDRSTVSPSPPEDTVPTRPTRPIVDLEEPPEEDEKHTGLNRWRKKDLGEALEDGDIGNLLLCLCSKYPEIRIQAANNIHQLLAGLETSGAIQFVPGDDQGARQQVPTEPSSQQLYLLLGEVLETVEGIEGPFPYLGGALAARSAGIVADPTHPMFSKINRFLTKAPAWNLHHLLSEFWHSIVTQEPDDDGTYHVEVDWFLDYLLDALRTPADMNYFRKSNIFEQLLSHYSSRSCAAPAKEKILRILLRATHVEGSTTLITRCGVIAWAQMMADNHDPRNRMLQALVSQLHNTCDRERIDEWSSGSLKDKAARASLVVA